MSAEIGGFPVWQVMLAEIVVGMYDGRIAAGRTPGRNVELTVAQLPVELVDIARQQNATRAARDEKPASGPRFRTSVPELDGPTGYPGTTRRKKQALGDHVRNRLTS